MVIELTKRKKLSFVNIVNTNTFFYSNEKLSQSYAHMDSHGATFEYPKCHYRGGLQFLGHTFLEGAGFWAVNLRGAKIFRPSLLK